MKAETRSFPRKHMRCNAVVVLPGMAPMRAKTQDIALGGACLIMAEQLRVGQECTVAFEALLNGKPVRVTATAKVVYSILAGTEGFRTGMQFVQIDPASNKTLAELML